MRLPVIDSLHGGQVVERYRLIKFEYPSDSTHVDSKTKEPGRFCPALLLLS
jgi:hypothetical protein